MANVDLTAAPKATSSVSARAVLVSGWDTIASIPQAKGYGAVFVIDNNMYVAGGYTASGYTDSTHMYDPVTHTWSTKAVVSYGTYSAGGAAYNGKGYVTGGYIYGANNYGYIQEYNPGTNAWTYRATQSWSMLNQQAVTANNGLIYMIGGGHGNVSWFNPVNGATGYNAIGITNPNGCRACLGDDGWIYVTGGDGNSTLHYKFNPATGASAFVAALPEWRHWHTMVKYKGLHYIMGGHKAGQSNTTSVIAYDPLTNTYSTKPNALLGVAHAGAAMVTEDGLARILVAGGHNGSVYVANSYRYTSREVDVAAAAVAKAIALPFAAASAQVTGRALVTANASVAFGETFDVGMVELTGVARPAGTYPDMVPVRSTATLTRPGLAFTANAQTINTKTRGLRLAALNNDMLADAINLFGASGEIHGNTTGKTMEVGEPEPLPGYGYFRGSWYKWTAPSTGEFRFTTYGSASEFGYADLIIAAYSGVSFGTFQTVAYGDESSEYEGPLYEHDGEPSISFEATSGTSYYLVVGTWNDFPIYDKEYKLSWEEVPTTQNLLAAPFALAHGWYEEPYKDTPGSPAAVTRSTISLSRRGNPTVQVIMPSGTALNALTHAPVNVTPGQRYTFAFDGMFTLPETNGVFACDLFFYDPRDPDVDGWSYANKLYRWFTPDDGDGYGYGHGAGQELWFREYASAIAPPWATMVRAEISANSHAAGSVFRIGDPSLRLGFGREYTAPNLQHATVTEATVMPSYRNQQGSLSVADFQAEGRGMRAWIPDPFNFGGNPYYASDFDILT